MAVGNTSRMPPTHRRGLGGRTVVADGRGVPARIAVFSAQSYDRRSLNEANAREDAHGGLDLVYLDAALSARTAALANGCEAVCLFVNDQADARVLEALVAAGVRAVFLRCAGFNNVDVAAASRLGLFVARVPAYSPEAVAEHAIALVMTLNRQTHRAFNRVREGNFMLDCQTALERDPGSARKRDPSAGWWMRQGLWSAQP